MTQEELRTLQDQFSGLTTDRQKADFRLVLLNSYRSCASGVAEQYWLRVQDYVGTVNEDVLASIAVNFVDKLLELSQEINTSIGLTDPSFDAEVAAACEAAFDDRLGTLIDAASVEGGRA